MANTSSVDAMKGTVRKAVQQIIPSRYHLSLYYYRALWSGQVEDELRFIKSLPIKPGIALDVGANRGIYSLIFNRLFVRVVAFEPNPDIVEMLLNHRSGNIELRAVAVSDEVGTTELHVPVVKGLELDGWASLDQSSVDFGDEVRTLQVPVVTLDSSDLTNVAFCKIDTEGFELNVLRGAVGVLERDKPAVLVEVKPENRGEVGKLMGGLGFTANILDRGKLVPLHSGLQGFEGEKENVVFVHGEG